MKTQRRVPWLWAVLCGVLLALPARAGLAEYVKKPEPKYSWKLKEKIKSEQGTIYDMHLTSQVWHDITWEHQLQVYQPNDVEPNGTMLIYNTGGAANPGLSSSASGSHMAICGNASTSTTAMHWIHMKSYIPRKIVLMLHSFTTCLR